MVIAPSLASVRPGDQVKTDRRDALRLAQLLQAGELTSVRVPSEEEEELRGLVRGGAERDLKRARRELTSFLLRHGVPAPKWTTRWSRMFLRWLDTLSFPHRATQVAFQEYLQAVHERQARVERLEAEIHAMATESRHAPVVQALQALKGVREVTAVRLVAEIGEISRFRSPAQLVAYAGLVPREHSGGIQTLRGGITKTGQVLAPARPGKASSRRGEPDSTGAGGGNR